MREFLQIDAVAKYKVVPQGAVPSELPAPPVRYVIPDGMQQLRIADPKEVPPMVSKAQTPFDIHVVNEQLVQKRADFSPNVNGHQTTRGNQVIDFNGLTRLGHHAAAMT